MRSKKTILIIDKDPGSGTSLFNFCNENYDIVSIDNGFEALNWCLNGNKADILLINIDHDIYNFSEISDCIRKKTGNKYLPVIALLSKQQIENKIRKLNAKVDGLYKKPFNPVELYSKITEMLN